MNEDQDQELFVDGYDGRLCINVPVVDEGSVGEHEDMLSWQWMIAGMPNKGILRIASRTSQYFKNFPAHHHNIESPHLYRPNHGANLEAKSRLCFDENQQCLVGNFDEIHGHNFNCHDINSGSGRYFPLNFHEEPMWRFNS